MVKQKVGRGTYISLAKVYQGIICTSIVINALIALALDKLFLLQYCLQATIFAID